MTLGLAGVSHMSIFNDFDETDRDEFYCRIINQFSMITVDSAPFDNHESNLGTGTNDFRNDTRTHAILYSGQEEGACQLFGNSIDTGNIAANISGSNCDHIYSVDDELLSNCDTKESVEDETNYNCYTKEKVRMKLILEASWFLWNRTVVVVVDKLSSTSVDFVRSERELENCVE